VNWDIVLPGVRSGKGSLMYVVALLLGATVGSCTDRPNVGPLIDKIPEWAGGMPKDVLPRPSTPEYEEYRKRNKSYPGPSGEKKDGA